MKIVTAMRYIEREVPTSAGFDHKRWILQQQTTHVTVIEEEGNYSLEKMAGWTPEWEDVPLVAEPSVQEGK